MERDFMGLGSRDSNAAVKEEIVDECKELDFVTFSKASSVEWPSLNKGSVPSHSMACNYKAEENTIKAFPYAETQKDPYGTRKSPFPLPTYPDAKIFPIPNQSISSSTFKSHFGGSTVLRPNPIHPSLNSVAGTTETRYNIRPSVSPPQLTIFYDGTVNVFDNISPDKAEAILFLAGSISAKGAQPRPRTQLPPLSKHEGCDVIHFSPQLVNTTPNYPGVSSPMSVSSHPIVQSGKDSRSKDEVMPIKPVAVLGTPVTRIDSPNIPASATLTPSAVPQARKASLTRFLEKRKERVIGSAPYNIGRDSPECSISELNGQ